MSGRSDANAGMRAFWGGVGGEQWVRHRDDYDEMLAPFLGLVRTAAGVGAGERVLDVGCGNGALTLDVAAAVGGTGAGVAGVDVSEPMLAVAAERAWAAGLGDVRFHQADAQVSPLDEVDVVVSRFGVMFFDDPVAAFTNLRASASGGRLAFVCWQPLERNAWMGLPMGAMAPYLAPQPPADPGAPSPWAFGDADHVADVLAAAGWRDLGIVGHEQPLLLGGGGPRERAEAMVLGTAATRGMTDGVADADLARARAALDEVLAAHEGPDGVAFPSAVWVVTATA